MADERRSSDRRVDDEGDERSKALRAFAESNAKVGGAISDLGVAIDYLVTIAKWFIGLAVIVGLLVAVGLGFLGWNAINGTRARGQLLTQTAEIKRTSDEVHSAVTPGQPIYEQAQKAQAAIIDELVNEDECRLRNALAHGPDVPPGESCLTLHPDQQGEPKP